MPPVLGGEVLAADSAAEKPRQPPRDCLRAGRPFRDQEYLATYGAAGLSDAAESANAAFQALIRLRRSL